VGHRAAPVVWQRRFGRPPASATGLEAGFVFGGQIDPAG
jgi:hypothetical protein